MRPCIFYVCHASTSFWDFLAKHTAPHLWRKYKRFTYLILLYCTRVDELCLLPEIKGLHGPLEIVLTTFSYLIKEGTLYGKYRINCPRQNHLTK